MSERPAAEKDAECGHITWPSWCSTCHPRPAALFHRLERTLPRLTDRQGSITAYLVPVEEWRRLRAAATRPIPPVPIRLGSCCVNVGTDACVCENPTNWGTPFPPVEGGE